VSNSSPNEIFRDLATHRHCVWLDAATGQGKSMLAADPFQVVRAKGRHTEIITPSGTQTIDGDPFDILKAELARQSGAGSASG
jgi:hypothetical protein